MTRCPPSRDASPLSVADALARVIEGRIARIQEACDLAVLGRKRPPHEIEAYEHFRKAWCLLWYVGSRG